MRRVVPAVLSLGLLAPAMAPAPASAQDMMEPGYALVETYEVATADIPAWEAAVKKFRAAAEAGKLGFANRWGVYQRDNRFWVVFFPQKMAEFDDPDHFMKEFEEAGQGDAVMEAMKGFTDLSWTGRSEVLQYLPELSYMPEMSAVQEGQQGGVYVISQFVKSGHEEAVQESVKGIMAILKEAGYPYPVFSHRVLFGELGRMDFVIAFDNLANFHGTNSLEKILGSKMLGEKWGAQMMKHDANIVMTRSDDKLYRADLSYMPSGM